MYCKGLQLQLYSLHYSEIFFLNRFKKKNELQIYNMHRKIRSRKEKKKHFYMTLILNIYIYTHIYIYIYINVKKLKFAKFQKTYEGCVYYQGGP